MALRRLVRTTGRSQLSGRDLTIRTTRALATYATETRSQTRPTAIASLSPAKHYSTHIPNEEPKDSPGPADFVSEGSDRTFVLAYQKSLTTEGQWEPADSRRALQRKFVFQGFKGCWDFMNAVAAECKKHRHHPEWTNNYNTTQIRWTTHKPRGLSEKDIIMARICDEKAREFGEVPVKVNMDVQLGQSKHKTEVGDGSETGKS